MSSSKDLKTRLDEILAELTSAAQSSPAQLPIIREFACRVQELVSTIPSSTASQADTAQSDGNSRSHSPDIPDPPLPPQPTIGSTTVSKSQVPAVLNNTNEQITTRTTRRKSTPSDGSRVVSKSNTIEHVPSKSVHHTKDKSKASTGNHNSKSAQPVNLVKEPSSAAPASSNALTPPSIVSTPSLPTLCRPVRKFSPTRDEWENFGDFYNTVIKADKEGIGAALIDLPDSIRQAATLTTGIRDISVKGECCRAIYMPNGCMNVQLMDSGGIQNNSSFRLNKSVDFSNPVITESFDKCVQSFEQKFDGVRNSCIYATGKDVENSDHRKFYGLPCVSAIFPLSGNKLETTRIAMAGIHTPWMYISEGFGTTFSLHTEDFNLTALNIVMAGASKIWTVISPLDAAKLEAFVEEQIVKRAGRCQQHVRHAGTYIPITKLEELGIRYTQFEQQKGQVVITLPYAYHQGFNTGFNVAEAVNFADSEMLSQVMKTYRRCTPGSCGFYSASPSNLQPASPGEAQKIIGIQNPADVEAVTEARGRKRKRIVSSKPDALQVASASSAVQSDALIQLKKQQQLPSNLDSNGNPVVPLIQMFSKLMEIYVEIDKVRRSIGEENAAIIASMIMAWGSPMAFKELCVALQALQQKPPLPIADDNHQMQRIVHHVRSLDHLDAIPLISAIATRYHLASFSFEFDSIAPPESAQQLITATYCDIIQELKPSLPTNSEEFKKLKIKLRQRLSYGRKWQKLIASFGHTVIALFPHHIQFGTCNNLILHMTHPLLNVLLQTLTSEQGPWITRIGGEMGSYIHNRLTANFDGKKLLLEGANPSIFDNIKYRAEELVGLCSFES